MSEIFIEDFETCHHEFEYKGVLEIIFGGILYLKIKIVNLEKLYTNL